ncbi:MAG: lipoyl synthase [Waddliaceae bacterium]|jgi:lipoyl synthase|nr:lipoyl synthase [Waddliaceae bacterium]MBT3579636.1 lipoyl synthase [Waddliaceae bacterium]MBT4445221.1 lipoyl synthase [Waddliaceae bacterium]MBT6928119.1 lipoyl synthase [Waddliaceae bacterium]MBT7264680.1 lipoyl synthase [Waddliaceae bacterium]
MKNKTDTAPRHHTLPPWLRRPLPSCGAISSTRSVLEKHRLNTVCEEAQCPNRLECFSLKTATFIAMGKECTRCCSFCDVGFSTKPLPLDPCEPKSLASAIYDLSLRHVVITMVTRDDLDDGGARHLADIISAIRLRNPKTTIEVLTSDFCYNTDALDIVIAADPDVFNHNIETVEALTSKIRHNASYSRSLDVLRYVKKMSPTTTLKSGMMVGFGESADDIEKTIRDLHDVGCDIVTIGQYLQPSDKAVPVVEFVTPEQFSLYECYGKDLGVKHMFCGPFVRSSYHAKNFIKKQ